MITALFWIAAGSLTATLMLCFLLYGPAVIDRPRERWRRWRQRVAQEREEHRLMEFYRSELVARLRENDRRLRAKHRRQP